MINWRRLVPLWVSSFLNWWSGNLYESKWKQVRKQHPPWTLHQFLIFFDDSQWCGNVYQIKTFFYRCFFPFLLTGCFLQAWEIPRHHVWFNRRLLTLWSINPIWLGNLFLNNKFLYSSTTISSILNLVFLAYFTYKIEVSSLVIAKNKTG